MTEDIIIVDTESMTEPWFPSPQPLEITRISAIRFNLESQLRIGTLDLPLRPSDAERLSQVFPLPAGALPFPEALDVLRMFCGETPVICYDTAEDIFRQNCERHGAKFPFADPWKKLRPTLPDLGLNPDDYPAKELHKLTKEKVIDQDPSGLYNVSSIRCFIKLQLQQKNVRFFEALLGGADIPAFLRSQNTNGTIERHPA